MIRNGPAGSNQSHSLATDARLANAPLLGADPVDNLNQIADAHAKLYIEPVGIVRTDNRDEALPLAGGPLAFTAARLWVREARAARAVAFLTAKELHQWSEDLSRQGDQRPRHILERLTQARPAFAGLDLSRTSPHLMGVVNVTPDSFSDGGDFATADAAIAHGKHLMAAGAQIIDVGGESTRPGAEHISVAEELRRVLPVIEGLSAAGACVSIDTRHAKVMQAALGAGAHLVNDVTALTGEDECLEIIARTKVPVVLMHMLGEPGTMQQDPMYDAAILDIYDYLEERIDACTRAGIVRGNLCVDPGIGFGKTVHHNIELLAHLATFHGLGCAILLGVSRKSFIAHLSGTHAPKERLPGSLAAAFAGINQGVHILRVHDVSESAQALAVWQALRKAS